MRIIAQLALITALFIAPAFAAEIPSSRVPDGLGVNIHFDHPQPGEFEMLLAGGFKIMRTDILWDQSELKRGQYDFSRWDELFALYDKHHVRALALLAYTNPLYDNNLSPHTDEGVAAFARWAATAVHHFEGRGVMWEIYNEPNNVFWRPQPDVNAYIKLALATARAIREVAPDEMIIGPALAGTDGAWLEPCYKAGLLEYFDAITVHPYGNSPPEERERHYRGVRNLIDRYQPKGKSVPIFSGEWGYSSAMYPPETQGKLLARQWLFNLSMNIPVSIWYDWRDDGSQANVDNRFGTVENEYHKERTPPLAPKPAYTAAKTLTTQLSGFTFSTRLPLASKEDFVLLFQRGDEVRAAAWTKSDKPHVVNFPFGCAAGVRVTDFLGKSLPDIAVQNAEIAIELTDGPKYLRP